MEPVSFYSSALIGFFLGFAFGVGCALAVLYSIYMGGYRARRPRRSTPPAAGAPAQGSDQASAAQLTHEDLSRKRMDRAIRFAQWLEIKNAGQTRMGRKIFSSICRGKSLMS